jgi:hypothetical protein
MQRLGVGGATVALALVAGSVALARSSPPGASKAAIGNAKSPPAIGSEKTVPAAGSLSWQTPASLASPVPNRSAAFTPTTAACAPGAPCAPSGLFTRHVGAVAVTATIVPGLGAPGPLRLPSGAVLPSRFGCAIGSTLAVRATLGSSVATLSVTAPSTARSLITAVATTRLSDAGADAALVVLRVSSSATLVVGHFSDGASDEMRPVAGWAVLVDRGPHPTATGTFGSVTLFGPTGDELTAPTPLVRLPGIAYPLFCLGPVTGPTPDSKAG